MRIFKEKMLNTCTSTPTLTDLLAAMRKGDVVIINRLAQLGRNTMHMIQLVEKLNRCGVHFRALYLGTDSRPSNSISMRTAARRV